MSAQPSLDPTPTPARRGSNRTTTYSVRPVPLSRSANPANGPYGARSSRLWAAEYSVIMTERRAQEIPRPRALRVERFGVLEVLGVGLDRLVGRRDDPGLLEDQDVVQGHPQDVLTRLEGAALLDGLADRARQPRRRVTLQLRQNHRRLPGHGLLRLANQGVHSRSCHVSLLAFVDNRCGHQS